jgi:hypothetical protein
MDDEIDPNERALAERTSIDAALVEAVRAARQRHRAAGNPVVAWHDGQACWIAPEDIESDDEKKQRR